MKTYQLEIKWGVIFTIALILWALLERLVGLHSTYIALHPTLTMLFAIVAIAIYVVALRSIRATRPEFTYKHAFISGGIITLVVTVLSPLTQWFIHHIVTPDFFTNAKIYAIDAGIYTPAEANAYFNFNNYLWQSALGALVMGVLTTSIVAIFVSRNNIQK